MWTHNGGDIADAGWTDVTYPLDVDGASSIRAIVPPRHPTSAAHGAIAPPRPTMVPRQRWIAAPVRGMTPCSPPEVERPWDAIEWCQPNKWLKWWPKSAMAPRGESAVMMFAEFGHRLATARLVPHTSDRSSPELGERVTTYAEDRRYGIFRRSE